MADAVPYIFNPGIRFPAYLIRKGLLQHISSNAPYLKGRMMDFGCGSKPYRSLFNVEEYIGVDYNGEGHSHEKEQIDVLYDGHHIPFPDQYFDSVFTSEVFEHIFNLEEIIPEINRVMRTGAVMLITCPFAIAEHEQPADFARYSSFGLQHLLKKNGFKIVNFEKIGSSFETIMQLKMMYYHMHVMPKFNKLIIVKPVVEFLLYPVLNIYTKIMNRILPRRYDLYMNNLVVCEKIS